MTIAYCIFLICTSDMKCMKKSGYFNGDQYAAIVFDNLAVGNSVKADCTPVKPKGEIK